MLPGLPLAPDAQEVASRRSSVAGMPPWRRAKQQKFEKPPWGNLFSDRTGEMGLDGAIEILGPPRSKREALISYHFRAKRGTVPLRASPRL